MESDIFTMQQKEIVCGAPKYRFTSAGVGSGTGSW
jgi:hypothetical protein